MADSLRHAPDGSGFAAALIEAARRDENFARVQRSMMIEEIARLRRALAIAEARLRDLDVFLGVAPPPLPPRPGMTARSNGAD